MPVYAAAPYLKFVKEYNYPKLIDTDPQGRLDLIVTICKLMNDGTSSYDWYFYSNIPAGAQGIRLETVPGKVCYNSSYWETSETHAKHTVWNAGTYR